MLASAFLEALVPCETKLSQVNSFHLIIAGSYHWATRFSSPYYKKLQTLINQKQLTNYVTMIKSPSEEQKHYLFENCSALIQTCDNEHFGIVPVEAMWRSKPVIAVEACGFLETVVHGETGILVAPNNPRELAERMKEALEKSQLYEKYGRQGRKHAEKIFSFEAFSDKMIRIINNI